MGTAVTMANMVLLKKICISPFHILYTFISEFLKTLQSSRIWNSHLLQIKTPSLEKHDY